MPTDTQTPSSDEPVQVTTSKGWLDIKVKITAIIFASGGILVTIGGWACDVRNQVVEAKGDIALIKQDTQNTKGEVQSLNRKFDALDAYLRPPRITIPSYSPTTLPGLTWSQP